MHSISTAVSKLVTQVRSWVDQHQVAAGLIAGLGIVGLVCLTETVFYPGFFHLKTGGVRVWWIMVAFLSINLVVRLVTKQYLHGHLFRWLWHGLGLLSVVTYFFTISVELIHANFIFSTLRLHPEPFQIYVWFLVGLVAVNIDPKILKKHWREFVWWLPVVIFVTMATFKWHHQHLVFNKLKREDGVFEYLTFSAFVVASVSALSAVRKASRLNWLKWLKLPLMAFFLVLAIGFGAIAGEEISWGQRIFGIETPEEYAAVNTQNEITIHNHHDVINHVYYAYASLSLYSMTMWIVLWVLQRLPGTQRLTSLLWLITPSWYLALFFLPTLVYVYLRETYGYIVYGDWEEFTEMIQAFGLAGFSLSLRFGLHYQKKQFNWLQK